MRKVLCVCFGNTCRSPMMEAMLQRELGDTYIVESAGVSPKAREGEPANEHSVLCIEERGMDLINHRSRFVGELKLEEYSHIICVGESEAEEVYLLLDPLKWEARSPLVLIANREGGGVPNPWQKGPLAYQACARLLDVEMWKVAELIRA